MSHLPENFNPELEPPQAGPELMDPNLATAAASDSIEGALVETQGGLGGLMGEIEAKTDSTDATLEAGEEVPEVVVSPEVQAQISEISALADVPPEDQGSRKQARRIMRELVDPQNSSVSKSQIHLDLIYRQVGPTNFARLFYKEIRGGKAYKMDNHNMPILRTAEGLGMMIPSTIKSFTIQDGREAIVAVRQGNIYVNQATGEPMILEDTFIITNFSMDGLEATEGLTLAQKVALARQKNDQLAEEGYFTRQQEAETTATGVTTEAVFRANEAESAEAEIDQALEAIESQRMNEQTLSQSFEREVTAGREVTPERMATYSRSLESINVTGVTLTSVDLNDSDGGSMTAMLGGQGGVEVKIYPEQNRMVPASFNYDPVMAVPVDTNNLTLMQVLDTATDQSVTSRQQHYKKGIVPMGGMERLAGLFGQLYPFRGVPLEETTVQSFARGFEKYGVQRFFAKVEQDAQQEGEVTVGKNLINPRNGRLLTENANVYRAAIERMLKGQQVRT